MAGLEMYVSEEEINKLEVMTEEELSKYFSVIPEQYITKGPGTYIKQEDGSCIKE